MFLIGFIDPINFCSISKAHYFNMVDHSWYALLKPEILKKQLVSKGSRTQLVPKDDKTQLVPPNLFEI